MARNYKRDRKGRFAKTSGGRGSLKTKRTKAPKQSRKARKQQLYGSKDRSKNTKLQNKNRNIRNINRTATAIRVGILVATVAPMVGGASGGVNMKATRRNSQNFRNAQSRGLKAGPIVGSKVRGGATRITNAAPPRRGYR